jgi:hypothetical protein
MLMIYSVSDYSIYKVKLKPREQKQGKTKKVRFTNKRPVAGNRQIDQIRGV